MHVPCHISAAPDQTGPSIDGYVCGGRSTGRRQNKAHGPRQTSVLAEGEPHSPMGPLLLVRVAGYTNPGACVPHSHKPMHSGEPSMALVTTGPATGRPWPSAALVTEQDRSGSAGRACGGRGRPSRPLPYSAGNIRFIAMEFRIARAFLPVEKTPGARLCKFDNHASACPPRAPRAPSVPLRGARNGHQRSPTVNLGLPKCDL